MGTETDNVKDFYDDKGWKVDASSGVTLDTKLWDISKKYLQDYGHRSDQKILTSLEKSGEFFLDAGSGPARRADYLESYNFQKRVCIDISGTALSLARDKLGDQCKYAMVNLTHLPFSENIFDTSISLHVIYHIPKNDQERAVRELIRVTKPKKPIVIAYRNPLAPIDIIQKIYRMLRLNKVFAGGELYFYTHRLGWWRRFLDSCELKMLPLYVLPNRVVRMLIPDNSFGKAVFKFFSAFEEAFPALAVRLWSYPLIVLIKKP
jgi:ubiquinone/menaquinone biosynthesis C-methylase UbiE